MASSPVAEGSPSFFRSAWTRSRADDPSSMQTRAVLRSSLTAGTCILRVVIPACSATRSSKAASSCTAFASLSSMPSRVTLYSNPALSAMPVNEINIQSMRARARVIVVWIVQRRFIAGTNRVVKTTGGSNAASAVSSPISARTVSIPNASASAFLVPANRNNVAPSMTTGRFSQPKTPRKRRLPQLFRFLQTDLERQASCCSPVLHNIPQPNSILGLFPRAGNTDKCAEEKSDP